RSTGGGPASAVPFAETAAHPTAPCARRTSRPARAPSIRTPFICHPSGGDCRSAVTALRGDPSLAQDDSVATRRSRVTEAFFRLTLPQSLRYRRPGVTAAIPLPLPRPYRSHSVTAFPPFFPCHLMNSKGE